MTIEMEAHCEDCGREADRGFCEKHLDERFAEEYERGRTEGYKAGKADGLEEAKQGE